MSHDVGSDLLRVVWIGLLGLKSFLPGGFVANGPFAFELNSGLSGEVRP